MNIVICLLIIIILMITIVCKYPESKLLIHKRKYLKNRNYININNVCII